MKAVDSVVVVGGGRGGIRGLIIGFKLAKSEIVYVSIDGSFSWLVWCRDRENVPISFDFSLVSTITSVGA